MSKFNLIQTVNENGDSCAFLEKLNTPKNVFEAGGGAVAVGQNGESEEDVDVDADFSHLEQFVGKIRSAKSGTIRYVVRTDSGTLKTSYLRKNGAALLAATFSDDQIKLLSKHSLKAVDAGIDEIQVLHDGYTFANLITTKNTQHLISILLDVPSTLHTHLIAAGNAAGPGAAEKRKAALAKVLSHHNYVMAINNRKAKAIAHNIEAHWDEGDLSTVMSPHIAVAYPHTRELAAARDEYAEMLIAQRAHDAKLQVPPVDADLEKRYGPDSDKKDSEKNPEVVSHDPDEVLIPKSEDEEPPTDFVKIALEKDGAATKFRFVHKDRVDEWKLNKWKVVGDTVEEKPAELPADKEEESTDKAEEKPADKEEESADKAEEKPADKEETPAEKPSDEEKELPSDSDEEEKPSEEPSGEEEPDAEDNAAAEYLADKINDDTSVSMRDKIKKSINTLFPEGKSKKLPHAAPLEGQSRAQLARLFAQQFPSEARKVDPEIFK